MRPARKSIESRDEARMGSDRLWLSDLAVALMITWSVLLASSSAIAADEETPPDGFVAEFMDAMIHGKPTLDVRFRWENAKIDGKQTSNALTVRTRLGYGTKPLHGVSGLLEFENVASPKPSGYFDGIDTSNANRTLVADPEDTAANRFWLKLERKDWLDSSLKVGSQRVEFDDERWVPPQTDSG